ncbi:MAG: hypothetical protein OXF02_02165 [Simkaniaceae bacterium]|nr:hypothetical protein [Simkaniaceae bacterium]
MQKKLSYKETVYKVVLAQKKILNNALFFSSLFGGCCALAGALLPTFPSPSIKAGLIAGVVIGVPVGVLRANIDLAMELRETENRARELSNQRLAMASLITEQHRCLGVGIPRPPSRSETENLNGD